mmetsp:Transcript_9162/g.21394  ORF Transcript_9162/g.21394 Transcript_9162/m.21394 type:complete len:252 (-) Transcript_9162:424-1179(-)
MHVAWSHEETLPPDAWVHEPAGGVPHPTHRSADVEHVDLRTHVRVVMGPLVKSAMEGLPIEVSPACPCKVPNHGVLLQRVRSREELPTFVQQVCFHCVQGGAQTQTEKLDVAWLVVTRPNQNDWAPKEILTGHRSDAAFQPLANGRNAAMGALPVLGVVFDKPCGILNLEVCGNEPRGKSHIVERIMQRASVGPDRAGSASVPECLQSCAQGVLWPSWELLSPGLTTEDAVPNLADLPHDVLEPCHFIRCC